VCPVVSPSFFSGFFAVIASSHRLPTTVITVSAMT
jgi:hypothetical protein